MPNATMIVPIGNFTPQLARRVNEAALATAQQRDVIISMQSMRHLSWSALCDFAQSLSAAGTPHRIRLAGAVPRTRALLRELGIEGTWFLSNDDDVPSRARILICEP